MHVPQWLLILTLAGVLGDLHRFTDLQLQKPWQPISYHLASN